MNIRNIGKRWYIVTSMLLVIMTIAIMAVAGSLSLPSPIPWTEGNGTEEDPYLIATISDLTSIADSVNAGHDLEGVYFKQSAYIDLAGQNWTPIGYYDSTTPASSKYFQGHYNGHGNSISNLVITGDNSTQSYGLFGAIGSHGTISNLIITSARIDNATGTNTGAIAGYCEGLITSSSVGNSDNFEQGYITGLSNTGGVVGTLSSTGRIANSSINLAPATVIYPYTVNGMFIQDQATTSNNIGGIVGNALGSVNDCSVGSSTTIGSPSMSGGIAGSLGVSGSISGGMFAGTVYSTASLASGDTAPGIGIITANNSGSVSNFGYVKDNAWTMTRRHVDDGVISYDTYEMVQVNELNKTGTAISNTNAKEYDIVSVPDALDNITTTYILTTPREYHGEVSANSYDVETTYSALAFPGVGPTSQFVWASDNTGVATVTNATDDPGAGMTPKHHAAAIKYVSAGNAKITGTFHSYKHFESAVQNTYTSDINVTVDPTYVSILLWDDDRSWAGYIMQINSQRQLYTLTTPENPTDSSVTWSSSSPEVISVDQTGKITALSDGYSTITATANGSDPANPPVYTQKYITVVTTTQSITADKSEFVLANNNRNTYTFHISPVNGADKDATLYYTKDGGTETQFGLASATADANGKLTFDNIQIPSPFTTGHTKITAKIVRSSVDGTDYPTIKADINVTFRDDNIVPDVNNDQKLDELGNGVINIPDGSSEKLYLYDMFSLMKAEGSLPSGIDGDEVIIRQPNSDDITIQQNSITSADAVAAMNAWWNLSTTTEKSAMLVPATTEYVKAYETAASTDPLDKNDTVPMMLKFMIHQNDLPAYVKNDLDIRETASEKEMYFRDSVPVFLYIRDGESAVHAIELNSFLNMNDKNNYVKVVYNGDNSADKYFIVTVRTLIFNQNGTVVDPVNATKNQWVTLANKTTVPNNYFIIQDGIADNKFFVSAAVGVQKINTASVNFTVSGDIPSASVDYYITDSNGNETHYFGNQALTNIYAGESMSGAPLVVDVIEHLTGVSNTGLTGFNEEPSERTNYKRYNKNIYPGDIIDSTIVYTGKKVTEISFNDFSLEIGAPGTGTSHDVTAQPTFMVTPDDAKDKSIEWSVGNPAIISVDQNGIVTAIGTVSHDANSSTVTATAKDGSGISHSASVTVTQQPYDVDITAADLIGKGLTSSATATVTPSYISQSVVWTVESLLGTPTDIARVDASGTITAVETGTFVLRATCSNGITTTKNITVVIPVTSVSLNKNSGALQNGGSTDTLVATVLPEDATDRTVTWSSSAPAIASVLNGVVTPHADGRATITATTNGVYDGSTPPNATCSYVIMSEEASSSDVEVLKGLQKKNSDGELPSGIDINDNDLLNPTHDNGNISESTISATLRTQIADLVSPSDPSRAEILKLSGNSDTQKEYTISADVTKPNQFWSGIGEITYDKDDSLSNISLLLIVKEGDEEHAYNLTSLQQSLVTSTTSGDTVTLKAPLTVFNQPGTVPSGEDGSPHVSILKDDSNNPTSFLVMDGATDDKYQFRLAVVGTTSYGRAKLNVTVTGAMDITSADYYVIEGNDTVSYLSGDHTLNNIYAGIDNTGTILKIEIKETIWSGEVTSLAGFNLSSTTRSGYIAFQKNIIPGEEINANIVYDGKKVTSITFSPFELEIAAPGTGTSLDITSQPTFEIMPDDAFNKEIVWSVGDASVISVDINGIATALSARGQSQASTSVTATARDGGGASITVSTVVNQKPYEAVITASDTVAVSGTIQATAAVVPSYITQEVVWSVESPTATSTDVATVSDRGVVSGIKLGNFVLKATCINGITATKNMSVITPATAVSVTPSSLVLKEGQTSTIAATVKPDDATDKTVTWSTSSAAIATVSSAGVVTGHTTGQATITAKANGVPIGNSEVIATCKVTVLSSSATDADMKSEEGLTRMSDAGTLPTGIDINHPDLLTPSHAEGNVNTVSARSGTINVIAQELVPDDPNRVQVLPVTGQKNSQQEYIISADSEHPNRFWNGIASITYEPQLNVSNVNLYLLVTEGDEERAFNLSMLDSALITTTQNAAGSSIYDGSSTSAVAANTVTMSVPITAFNLPGTVPEDTPGAPNTALLKDENGKSTSYLVMDGITDDMYKFSLMAVGTTPANDPEPPEPDPEPTPGPDDGGGGCNTGLGWLLILAGIPLLKRKHK